MGRKVNFAEKPKKGPGKKTKKQPPPKFSKKLLGNGELFDENVVYQNFLYLIVYFLVFSRKIGSSQKTLA